MSRALGEKWLLIRHWQSNPSVRPISRDRLSPSLAFRRGTTYKQTRPDDMIWIIKYTVWKPSITVLWPGFKWIIPFWGGRRLSVSYKINIDSQAGAKAQIHPRVILSSTSSLCLHHMLTSSFSLFLSLTVLEPQMISGVRICNSSFLFSING